MASVIVEKHGRTYRLPTGLFIANQFVPATSGRTFKTIDPSTGGVITEVHEASAADVDKAVQAATQALPAWQNILASDRAKYLWKLADLIEQHKEELAELESLDNGKTVKDALGDVDGIIEVYRYFAGWTDKLAGQTLDIDPNMHAYTRIQPLGVIGQIIPWNYPLSMQAWKLAPALACGNTVVMKTSEKTPLSGLKLCELIVAAGFPAGVVNVLCGFGDTCGAAIARHPKIAKVAFTGSTAVGKKIMQMAAESNLKKVGLELGGKSPNIVYADADLDKAVNDCHDGIFDNMGQNCCAGSRVYVHEKIHDEFVDKFIAKLNANKVGNPRDPETTHGPVVDQLQFDSVMKFIDIGRAEGAKLMHGGRRMGTAGYFIEPTLFTDVKPDMRIYKEEIFGPVVCVVKFSTEEEVLALANDTEYGLAAAVHTNDLKRAVRMEKALQAGSVWINCYNLTWPQLPFGGFKQSGIGRELGEYGLREYTRKYSIQPND
ncbi:aldehyde dehydrogenase (NAD(P)(+)) ald5 [Gaertneriomyces sp. JEL0708]|nr:aldehyde dehydrogenase (NAD(P)(+)) ald5 [Gaertneriomyces sp. JEL0708]